MVFQPVGNVAQQQLDLVGKGGAHGGFVAPGQLRRQGAGPSL